jgi:hypothetical protein
MPTLEIVARACERATTTQTAARNRLLCATPSVGSVGSVGNPYISLCYPQNKALAKAV